MSKLSMVIAAATALAATMLRGEANAAPIDTSGATVNGNGTVPASVAQWQSYGAASYAVTGTASSNPLAMAGPTTRTYQTSYYRGSALLWTKAWVSWTVSSSVITSSTAWQTCGAIFPSTAQANGVSLQQKTSTMRLYGYSWTVGGGIPTPWGNLNAYTETSVDRIYVYANGSATVVPG